MAALITYQLGLVPTQRQVSLTSPPNFMILTGMRRRISFKDEPVHDDIGLDHYIDSFHVTAFKISRILMMINQHRIRKYHSKKELQ